MFTLQQLKYALEIAERGSISEAARRLYITQPGLSNAIRELEDILGLTIFTRTKKGISVTYEGSEFLAQARQLVQQADLVAEKYARDKETRQHFRVSSQHYSFATEAFVELIKRFGGEGYELSIHETRTVEIIEDVKNFRSEVGILYISDFNSKIITKLLKEGGLSFQKLFTAIPHVVVRNSHPLARRKSLEAAELAAYPYVTFEQGEHNSIYFSEELASSLDCPKSVKVNDRAAILNVLIGTEAFTVSTGIMSVDLSGGNFTAIPLKVNDEIQVGAVIHRKAILSPLGAAYLDILRQVIGVTSRRRPGPGRR
ncbi:LysR family transcriptional regulator [Deltaproteobacteria bacterium OttesenSCG-928-M10]|nr:LysR family transcriptional regulator [Deltaproteobacteria bacterium OttesenSCG-928-M10]